MIAEFRSPDLEIGQLRKRLVVAGVFMFVCLSLLGARFFYLQVVRFEYFHTRAEDNRIALVPVVPNRGTVVDRTGGEGGGRGRPWGPLSAGRRAR